MSNFWAEVGFHNGARGKVVDSVYNNLSGPQSGAFLEAVVVQFWGWEKRVDPFLTRLPKTVAIATIQY